MQERMMNEYRFNSKFREYVDKYCNKHKISPEAAMEHQIIRLVYLVYTEV